LYLQFRFDDDCWLNAIDAVSEKSVSVVEANVDKKVTAPMNVNDCEVCFQLDSAADVNTICKKFVRKDQVRPTSITLRVWNKTSMKPLGEANLTVKNPSTGDKGIVTLIVVPNGHANLLGFKTVQNMGLITVNNDRFIANIVVQEIGDLGVEILQVNDEVNRKRYRAENDRCRCKMTNLLREMFSVLILNHLILR
jgi:hypothetical protein